MKGHRYACTLGLFCCGIFGLVPLIYLRPAASQPGGTIATGLQGTANQRRSVHGREHDAEGVAAGCWPIPLMPYYFVATEACWGRDVPATASAYALSGHSTIGYFTKDNKGNVRI
jgi:hypothetical protein